MSMRVMSWSDRTKTTHEFTAKNAATAKILIDPVEPTRKMISRGAEILVNVNDGELTLGVMNPDNAGWTTLRGVVREDQTVTLGKPAPWIHQHEPPQVGRRLYVTNGRYDYTAVDVVDGTSSTSGVLDCAVAGLTKKAAERFASECNAAYQAGYRDALADLMGQERAGWWGSSYDVFTKREVVR